MFHSDRKPAPPNEIRSTPNAPRKALCGSAAVLLTIAAICGSQSADAETWTYSGTENDWANPANWTEGATFPSPHAPPGVDGEIYNDIRLNIRGTLTYGAAQGNQTYDISQAQNEVRALTIGDGGSGALTLTGGTLTLIQEGGNTSAYLANGAHTGSLTLSGGNLMINEVGNGSVFAVTWTGGGTGNLTINAGSTLSVDRVSFGQANPDNATGTGTLNLNAGGVLEVRTIRENSSHAGSVATLNFDGGTIRVRGEELGGFALLENRTAGGTPTAGIDSANILEGGLTVDTNGVTARIETPLVAGDALGGGLTKIGEGTLVIESEGSTYTGNTVVNAGTLQIGNNGTVGSLGLSKASVAAGATLAIRRSDTLVQSTFTGSGISEGFSGPGNLAHTGSGLLTLDVANTHTGTITIANNSHLRITHANALGSTEGITIVRGSGGTGESDGSGGSLELVGGETGLTITGETVTIQGSGGQSLTGGAQQRGALQGVSGNVEWAGTVNIAGTNTRIGIQDGAQLTLSGTITDNGEGHRLIFRGGGSSSAADNVGTITIAGANNSWSETLVFGGTVRIAGDNVMPTSAALLVGTSGVGGSVFDLNGYDQVVAGLSQTADNNLGVVTNKGTAESVLTIANSTGRTYLGQIVESVGKISVVKTGSFDQKLTNNNLYTGDTVIEEGRLIVNGSVVGSEVTVEGGTLSGNGTIAPGPEKDVLVLAGGKLEPGDASAGVLNIELSGGGKLDISTGVAASGSQALVFELGAPGNSDLVTVSGGALHIGTGVLAFNDFAFTPLTGFEEGTYTLFSTNTSIVGTLDPSNLTGAIGELTGTLGIDGTNVVLTVVPEPGSAVALLAGTAVLIGFRRRRR